MTALPRFEDFSMQTARLLLAPPREDELLALAGLWLEFHGKGGSEGQRLFKFIAQKQVLQQMIFWAIRLKNTEAIVGSCEFNRMDVATGTAVVGCALKKDYQKQGYMYEALCAVVEFGFTRCGFAALYADIAKDNRPSLSLFLKMGFAPVEKDATRWLPNGARHFSLSRERAVNGSQIQHDFNLRTVSEK